MQGRKLAMMESLRARIAALETRPVLAESAGMAVMPAGEALLVAAPGLLQEIHADERHNGGAALGFALASARTLLIPARPVLMVMQLKRETGDMGLPYGAGLKSFGIDPDAVVLTRAETIAELLWAIEEAVSCRAVAAVIADVGGAHKGLDFTASRRLSLRAAASGTSVLMLRYGREREASAASLRWQLMPEPSGEVPFDARAPGGPRWRAVLEKGRLGRRAGSETYLLDWTEHGFVVVESGKRDSSAAAAALSGAEPAALGHRLPQAS